MVELIYWGEIVNSYIATKQDISWMVDLSHAKRAEYEKHQKQFWKMAKNSDDVLAKWFEEEVFKEGVIALCSKDRDGFIIGKIISPPEVYDAGLTLMIDDFCVKSPDLWQTVGRDLVVKCIKIAKEKNAKQVLIVCGDHDLQKSKLLEELNLQVASRWYVNAV